MPATSSLSRIRNVLHRHGVLRTLRLAAVYAKDRMLEWKPKRRRALRQEREFDRQFGIETSKIMPVSVMGLEPEAAESTYRYQPTPIPEFRQMMAALDIEFERTAFIDLGCGKGRTLLLAADHPFREIIGVELAPELCQQAERNIAVYHSASQRCSQINVVQHDAATFPFPNSPLVVYLYNPFSKEIMEKVLANLQRSLEAAPRPVSVVYYNPTLQNLFDRQEFLGPVRRTASYCIYGARV